MKALAIKTPYGRLIIRPDHIAGISPASTTDARGATAILHNVSSVMVGGQVIPVPGTPEEVAKRFGIDYEDMPEEEKATTKKPISGLILPGKGAA